MLNHFLDNAKRMLLLSIKKEHGEKNYHTQRLSSLSRGKFRQFSCLFIKYKQGFNLSNTLWKCLHRSGRRNAPSQSLKYFSYSWRSCFRAFLAEIKRMVGNFSNNLLEIFSIPIKSKPLQIRSVHGIPVHRKPKQYPHAARQHSQNPQQPHFQSNRPQCQVDRELIIFLLTKAARVLS